MPQRRLTPEQAEEIRRKADLISERTGSPPHYGNTIRTVRKRLRISQTEFAKLAGLSQPMLSRYERGDRNLSPEMIESVKRGINEALINWRPPSERFHNLEAIQQLGIKLRETPEEIEIKRVNDTVSLLERQIQTLNEIVRNQDEMITLCRERSGTSETQIADLEQRVQDLRSLYVAETDAALAHDKARELRAKVTAGKNVEESEGEN
jgi:transcriptional regulator with XRE-family HTH domain